MSPSRQRPAPLPRRVGFVTQAGLALFLLLGGMVVGACFLLSDGLQSLDQSARRPATSLRDGQIAEQTERKILDMAAAFREQVENRLEASGTTIGGSAQVRKPGGTSLPIGDSVAISLVDGGPTQIGRLIAVDREWVALAPAAATDDRSSTKLAAAVEWIPIRNIRSLVRVAK